MSQTSVPRADLLLVTVTDSETDAVRDVLHEHSGRSLKTAIVGKRPYYDLGILGGARVWLTRSEMGAGGGGGSLLTIDSAIRDLSPATVIMVGIAFGLRPDEHQIGDVLVARQLMLYDLQRVGTGDDGSYVVRPRGERVAPTATLLARCRVGRDIWGKAPVRFGLILSGEKLIGHFDFREQLRKLEPEAIGGEMEGAGLYAAAQRHKTDWILIKAITDWADGKKSAGEPGHQQMAARNAAAFALHVIEQGGWVDQAPPSSAEQLQASVDEPVTTLAHTPRLEELTLGQLRQLLHDGMSTAELQTMCFDLSIDPEDLSSNGKSALVRELISYLQRRKSLALLFDWLQQHRPDIAP